MLIVGIILLCSWTLQDCNHLGQKKIKEWCEDTFIAAWIYEDTKNGTLDSFYDMVGFSRDDSGVFHAKDDAWQQYFGYNDMYDFFFGIGTSMEFKKLQFSVNEQSFVLWLWKGDYLNLGAGGEAGLYYGDESNIHFQCATQYDIPMQLRVFKGIDDIVNYSDETWWITGFNPEYHQVEASELIEMVTIDFSNYSDLWDSFYNTYKEEGFTFNEEEKIVTIRW